MSLRFQKRLWALLGRTDLWPGCDLSSHSVDQTVKLELWLLTPRIYFVAYGIFSRYVSRFAFFYVRTFSRKGAGNGAVAGGVVNRKMPLVYSNSIRFTIRIDQDTQYARKATIIVPSTTNHPNCWDNIQ